jgi:hypothetical protein
VLIGAVDALHHRATLTDDDFTALSSHYNDTQILEIILLCGFYRTVSYVATDWRWRSSPKADGFRSRQTEDRNG